uniref:PAP-associated domain-containing protein n=1 Tax=Syphacia muris TaxID=451379 RepID=A0A0N5ASN6_9BILA
MKRLESFRSYLESLCQPSVSCGIDIFGSIKNGFGTKNSDVDLCLHLNPASVSTQRVNIQFHCPDDLKVTCHFHYLTVSNEVAMFNTKLLEVYGKLDSRVPQLGVALKVWAKCCNISGASEGWLSSYAYIIMLIHFLQSTEKPVLPFLQQVSFLTIVWLSPNSQTVAELWLDFFMYYAWVFDFENEVVQIRHPKKLTKKRKGWEASPLAMEDPFVLSHNLAATVDAEGILSFSR